MNDTSPPHAGPDHWLAFPSVDERAVLAAGLRLQLMPERAAFEPSTATLFVADVHVGKAAVFRARGLPVPQGTTTATLKRLSGALERSGASRLVVLGDFLHAHESHAPATLAALSAWRHRHPAVECCIVEGNHDRHAGRVQAALDMRTLPGAYRHGPLLGVHHPHDPHDADDMASVLLILAGHIHPVVKLRSRSDSLRLPCFWQIGKQLVLPAFGEFTGGFQVDTRSAVDQRFFVIGDSVIPLRSIP